MKAYKASSFHHPELVLEKSRAQLAKMILRLFDHWQLDTASKLCLLGLSISSRAMLSQYAKGMTAFPFTQDILDRAGWLLAIHQALRSLYPKNPELCYGWILLRNAVFQNLTPLEFMKTQGIIGIAKVARYLQTQLVK